MGGCYKLEAWHWRTRGHRVTSKCVTQRSTATSLTSSVACDRGWDGEFTEMRWHVAVETAVDQHTQLVLHAMSDGQPVTVSMQRSNMTAS